MNIHGEKRPLFEDIHRTPTGNAASTNRPARAQAEQWVGVATEVLGRVFAAAKIDTRSTAKHKSAESSKARAFLAKWAFVKQHFENCGYPDGYALNETCMQTALSRFGFSTWEVEKLLQLERRAKPLRSNRRQAYKNGFAVEDPLPKGRSEVRVPVWALELPSKVFAFIIATLLSPNAEQPQDVGPRIGIANRKVAHKLAYQAAETRLIELRQGPHKFLLVGRAGADVFANKFQELSRTLAKNRLAKNRSAKNRPTQTNWKPGTTAEDKAPPSSAEEGEAEREIQNYTADSAAVRDVDFYGLAFSDEHLLGGMSDEQSRLLDDLYARFDDVHARFDADDPGDYIEAAIPNVQLKQRVKEAAAGRVHRAILTPAGLWTIRHLAALGFCIRSNGNLDAHEAAAWIMEVIAASTAGGRWINSLKLVAARIAGDAYGSDCGSPRLYSRSQDEVME
ncbi:protein of unknown function [Hyphomicrobium sp. 1Nfss2.1]|uniref:hypothetical protein n=1 Tax=Hyphomicrobium sp. 1Nfss2.1 TaxID=3413936 RepID=UPI003C7E6D27